MDFVPFLIQTVEKAAAQNSQHALLSEAVAASVLLCHLSMLDMIPGETLSLSSVIVFFDVVAVISHLM